MKNIGSSISKSTFFNDFAGFLLQNGVFGLYLYKISFSKRSMKVGHLVNSCDFDGMLSII